MDASVLPATPGTWYMEDKRRYLSNSNRYKCVKKIATVQLLQLVIARQIFVHILPSVQARMEMNSVHKCFN